ncbi:hypothetical protein HBI56_030360 [Parastagonospora nodorum]|nr:hypothetical protein HBH53_028600 [Parastagonospora nodorum]KAH4034901.1 hypothetical protein HBI09_104680 [Parastagonospora nodorum]KAH4059372.1 hypothetical protein HBH49_017320 [Parastagonospora nodorum]KAH4074827.1 hypothetical protein HBH50_030340 [Parastagonospora nodorum]KAH4096887.1 hypothetical protein HBH48_039220 [Parastagonospora nodorum]
MLRSWRKPRSQMPRASILQFLYRERYPCFGVNRLASYRSLMIAQAWVWVVAMNSRFGYGHGLRINWSSCHVSLLWSSWHAWHLDVSR